MKPFYKDLPDVYDLKRMKGEIAKLTGREIELFGDTRSEYHRQLVDIRNLYRLVRAEVLDPKNQIPSRFAAIHNDLLRKNWGKMKTSMIIAEAYCG